MNFWVHLKIGSQSQIPVKMALMRVGFVGLGVMGSAMAMHIHRKGLPLTVWNRSDRNRKQFAEAKVPIAGSIQELAACSDAVVLCISRTEDVQNCLDSLLAKSNPGTLFIDHSTILPRAATQIHAKLVGLGHAFLDAPITGGSMGALNGTLTVFCGGEQKNLDRAKPIIECYAKRVELVGGPGYGQLMKAANQIAVAGSLQALCESLAFAQKAGLNVAQARELLALGAAGSWAFDHYGPKLIAEDWSPGFSIDNQVKDLEYCAETSRQMGAMTPCSELVNSLLKEMQAEGAGAFATVKLYEHLLGGHNP